jgi:hypothetical protein
MQCNYGQYKDTVITDACKACPEDYFCWNNALIESEITSSTPADIQRTSSAGNTLTFTGHCPSGYKCVTGATIFGLN